MSTFGSFNPTRIVPYDKRLIGQQPSFLPSYSTQPYYQTPYYSNGGYPILSYAQLGQYGMNSASFMHPIDRQYQYQQRWNYLNEMQKNYWKQQTDAMTLSLYAQPFPTSYTAGTTYPYTNTNQFIPYSDFDSFGRQRLNPQRVSGYGRPSNFVYTNWVNNNVANPNNARHLPPKIQAIFIPSGPVLAPQPYAGPLAMPPFLFNSISQPFCSLPLPPPLPPMASICLENGVQRILMQRYANPVAVFPFNPGWQIPQPMMPLSSIPPYQPPSIPAGVPILPAQIPQFQNSGYPRMYCICIPQPLSPNNPIPAATTNPNIRPTDNQITPLLVLQLHHQSN